MDLPPEGGSHATLWDAIRVRRIRWPKGDLVASGRDLVPSGCDLVPSGCDLVASGCDLVASGFSRKIYIFAMMASANADVFNSVAPAIWRARS